LQDGLPERLHQAGRRRSTTVGGALYAAWGEPPVVLRCGARITAELRRAEDAGGHVTVNGVYFIVAERAHESVFFASRVFVPVSVTVPDAYSGELVAELTSAIRRAQSF
jgi:hypothetical protein